MQKALLLTTILTLAACSLGAPQGYHQVKSVSLAGDGGWDYVRVDKENRKVYIAHDTKIDVLDADSGESVGVVQPVIGAHGVAVAPEYNRGFASSGKTDSVKVFDLKTLAITSTIPAGKRPDAVAYDHITKRVLAFNNGSNNVTVIDAEKAKKIGAIPLGGAPEFAIADDAGNVFVNLEDKNEMLKIDSKEMKVVKRWPLNPCDEPASLAMDRDQKRLFAGCGNSKLAVVNAENGHVITTLPIGEHVDATAYNPATHEVISSAADGTMTVIVQDDADHYHVSQTIKTPSHSKTFGLDKQTGRLYLPAADFGPAPAPSKENPKGRPQALPGTFKVLTFESAN